MDRKSLFTEIRSILIKHLETAKHISKGMLTAASDAELGKDSGSSSGNGIVEIGEIKREWKRVGSVHWASSSLGHPLKSIFLLRRFMHSPLNSSGGLEYSHRLPALPKNSTVTRDRFRPPAGVVSMSTICSGKIFVFSFVSPN